VKCVPPRRSWGAPPSFRNSNAGPGGEAAHSGDLHVVRHMRVSLSGQRFRIILIYFV
jgi:hypothetical protein